MIRLRMTTLLMLVCLTFCLSGAAHAQTVTGTLSGTATDATGAVVSGAKVTAKNTETGLTREGATNNEGYFNMPFLPLGVYDVTAEAQGFQKVIKTGVSVELNKNTVSNFKLEISSVGAEVRISGEAPLIETTTGEIKHSLDAKRIEDRPLAGRNFISLVEQIPGFQNTPGGFNGAANNPTNSTGSYASFSGQGTRSATFQIDGVNNDDSSENQNRQGVNISTIKEFQILTNAFSSEFGRAGGAVVLVQTKSGTNEFHGDVYNFIQNDIFNANGFFANRAGTNSITGQPISPRQLVRRNQYGWTFGGPVWLPKRAFGPFGFDGRNRLQFFISGERLSNKGSDVRTSFIFLPTDQVRACRDAAEAAAVRPGGVMCVDPATHPKLQEDLKFLNSILDLYKTPELEGALPNDPTACAEMIRSGRGNRCVSKAVQNTFPDSDYSGRLDFQATERDNIAFRYQYSRQIRRSGRLIMGDNFGTQNNRQYNLGLTATHIFSNRQVGEFRYGFGNRSTLQDVTDGNDIPTIRFNTSLCTGSFCNGTIIGTSTNVPINRRQHDHQFVYNHTISLNRHTFKAGIDQRFQLLDDLTLSALRGFWTFGALANGELDLARANPPKAFTGWENFLRGVAAGYQKGYGPSLAENRFGETNLYLEDKFALRRNLTLNLGVRYEYVRAPKENEDRFSYGYGADTNNVEPRVSFAWSPSVKDGWLHQLTGAEGQFVIRGGYGIFHSRIFQSIYSQSGLSLRAQPPNGFFHAFAAVGGTPLPRPNDVSDPTGGFVFTPGASTITTGFANANGVKDTGGRLAGNLLIPDPKLQIPYVQQWNLTIERQIGNSFALQVGYEGNRGIGLPFNDNTVNAAVFPIISPSTLVDVGGGNFKPLVFDRACTLNNLTDPICTAGVATTFSALSSATASLAQKGIVIENGTPHGYVSLNTLRLDERRPDPTRQNVFNLRNFGWSYYHALVVKGDKRLSHGLSFGGAYTFSKTIDTGSEATFTGTDINFPTGRKGNAAASLRGLSAFHAAHRFTVSYSYLLPFFSAQRGVIGRALGGWNVSGLTTLQSGNPFTVLAGYDVNGDGLGSDRPLLADLSLLGRSIDNGRQKLGGLPQDTLSQAQLPGTGFIPVAGTATAGRVFLPGSAGEGTVGRNTFFMDGLNYTDLSLFKEVKIRESMKFILRFELYNAFNQVDFDIPARTITDAVTFGRITAQRNPSGFVNSGRGSGARSGQLALRLVF
ncbi:MAG: carboxypeptidase regulatory-like domain-containing protein [Blastocatellia bacterium]